MRIAYLLCLLPLAGCVNTSSPEFAKKTERACLSYGFKPGSDQMANCRLHLVTLQEQKNERTGQALADATSDFGESQQRSADRSAYMLRNANPVYSNRTLNCTSYQYGNRVDTNCQ